MTGFLNQSLPYSLHWTLTHLMVIFAPILSMLTLVSDCCNQWLPHSLTAPLAGAPNYSATVGEATLCGEGTLCGEEHCVVRNTVGEETLWGE